MTEEQKLLSRLVHQFIESVTTDPRLNRRIDASRSVSISWEMDSGYDYQQRYKIDISLSVSEDDWSGMLGLIEMATKSTLTECTKKPPIARWFFLCHY